MKLQTKLSVMLIGGVLLIYLASCLTSRHVNLSAIDRFSQESRDGETARQWQWVECLHHATSVSLVNAMTDGDMDKFAKILADEREVPGLQELSLFDAKGRVAYSSDPGQAKKSLPDDLKVQLMGATQPVQRLTSESFEIYQPLRIEKSCIECHKERKPGEFCGVMSMHYSTASIRAAEQSWTTFNSGFRKTDAIASGVTIVIFTVGMGLLVLSLVQYQVAKPLKAVARNLSEQAEQVKLAADQTSAAGQSIAEGASEQAASLEETSASLEELSSTTKSNTDNAQQASELAGQARTAADQGVAGMREMSVAMSAIKDSSNDIAKIISTIDGIAFQTNILALNAAVEAARAGEAGMGFAVVADEVRNLAGRSAQAAKETAAKIEEAIHNVAHGAELNQKVSAVLSEIVDKARQVDELVATVAGASREQTQGISQINGAVNQMDKVTQGNAANAEESAAVSQELNSKAQDLNAAVDDLLRLLEGRATAEAALPAPHQFKSPAPVGFRVPSGKLKPAANGRRTAVAKRRDAADPELPGPNF